MGDNPFSYNGCGLVAMKGKNCVALASDTRLGVKYSTISTSFRKVFKMQDNILLGLSGLATDIQTFHKKMQYKLKMYQLRENRDMKAKTFASLVGTTLYEHRWGPFFVQPIVIGMQDGESILYDYDSIGNQTHSSPFSFVGTTGGNFGAMCESYYREDLGPDELQDVLSNVLVSGLDRDIMAGWGGIVYVMTDNSLDAKYIKTKMDLENEKNFEELQGTRGLKKFDCWKEDLKPEDWIQICNQMGQNSQAMCPYFQNGKYIWVDVNVLDYDKSKQRFLVEIQNINKGFRKYVSRLSLYFKKEDYKIFKKRVLQCKHFQKRAENKIFFIKYIESIDDQNVSSMPNNIVNQILRRVLGQKQKGSDYHFEQGIVSNIIKIIQAEYLREMKRCYVLEEMKDPEKKRFFEQKKIDLIEENKKRVEYEIIQNSNIRKSFSSKLEKLRQRNITRNPHMQEALKLFQGKCFKYKKTVLLNLNLLEKKLPFVLDDFIKSQKIYFDKNKDSLKTQWKEYPLGDICDILRNVNFFFASFNDIEEYKNPGKNSLERLIFRIDLMFRKHLMDFFQYNINKWINFLRQFVMPLENETWDIQESSFIQIQLKFKEKEKRKKTSKTNKNELIFFEPGFDQLFQQLTEPVRWLLDFMNSMTRLEAEIVKVLGIAPKKIFNLDESYKMVQECYTQIKHYLNRAFIQPNKVLKDFKEYQFLLENSKEEIIKTYTDNLRARSVKELETYLQKIITSIESLNKLYCNNYKTTFFEVQTKHLKDHLVLKAQEIKKGFLKKISFNVVKRINSIKQKYNTMKDNLQKKPQNEEELIELNKNIENCDSDLEMLDLEIKDTYEYILLMEKYGQQFQDDSMISYWLLKVCPLEVKISYNEARRTSNDQEHLFVQNLEEEKKKFESDIGNYKMEFDNLKKFDSFAKVGEFAKISEDLGSKLDTAKERKKDFNRREDIFEIQNTVYENLDKLIEDFQPYRVMWDKGFYFDSSKETWMVSQIIKLNFKKISMELEKVKVKVNRTLMKRFEEEGNNNALKVCREIVESIKQFEKNLPLIEFMTKDCMTKKSSNWKNLFKLLNIKTNQQNTSLQSLIQLSIMEKLDDVDDFVSKAEKEYELELKLNKEILEKLESMKVELMEHKQTSSYLIVGVDEIQTLLDDFLNSVILMKQSPYVKPIKRKVDEVEKKLIGMEDLFEEWIICQRAWLYLQPIFLSEDLKKKMPMEKKMFDQVDKMWLSTMEIVKGNPFIFESFDWEKAKNDFKNSNKTLDEVQKSLSDYLEAKRGEFPRFYFLSDDELIEIISKTKDPTCVTKYLNKCFEGINSLEFNKRGEIVKILSAQKEEILLSSPINVEKGDKKGNVEKWLGELETVMQKTMKNLTYDCLQASATEPRLEWLQNWPGQLLLAINSTIWTKNVETSIYENSLSNYLKQMQSDLSEVVDKVRQPLSPLQRNTLSSLIVIDVHSIYVVNELISKGITNIEQFAWLSQLRYYMNNKNLLDACIMISKYKYQYEYLGNSSRLVITPLTDRCYRTLMNAYQYYYGGAPEGPAGTGKTETVKDLAKAVAVQCVVFNCTDQINYVAMNKFFNGLSQTGSWCCFDEFNRIIPEVLSVIAVQVRTIQNAIKEKRQMFFFEGKNIKLVQSCSINITMNPGYAGRSELPDNLKALFRPCAMMVPNYSLIAEICLYSYGFQNANSLSKKIVVALKLSSEQLSSQKHYDFGMRALKSILVAAGNLKRTDANVQEDKLCLQALKNVNLPKFTKNDIPLFNSIIEDLFPGVSPPKKDWQKLFKQMEISCEEDCIIPSQNFLKKALEVYEMVLVRHGLMIVGENFAGKTKCLHTLQKGLKGINKDVMIKKINPKAVTGLQLYGFLDPNTKVWTEGVIPQVMKECQDEDKVNSKYWIVFDGPVDAEWIENMNTVLDDNKVLCLTNGQKIRLSDSMSMMFEVEDLNSASPATVSRCGMIFMEPDQLGWSLLLQKLQKFELSEKLKDYHKKICQIFEWLFIVSLPYVKKYCKLPLEINEMKIVSNCLSLFKILLKEYENVHGFEKLPKQFGNKLADLCLFAVIWGLGGIYDEKYRKEINVFLLKCVYYENVIESYKLLIVDKEWEPNGLSVSIKSPKNLFALKLDITSMEWVDWKSDDQIDFESLKHLRFEELIIPTRDSLRNSYFVQSIIKNNGHIMLTGPTGTGKTIGVLSDIEKEYNDKFIGNLCTNFSGQTMVNSVQRQIEERMSTRKGKKGFWGPEENKSKMIVFIDDINMPAKEKYGAQPPIELLRMMLDHRFWYDLETREKRHLVNLQFIGTMGPPSSGRNTMTSRFLRHFQLLYVTPFDDSSMFQIYDALLEFHFVKTSPNFDDFVIDLKEKVVKATLDLYHRIKTSKNLLPTPNKSHYLFSMRDITRVFQTITKSTKQSFQDKEDFVKIWAHESMRVFMDRLINKKDQECFKNLLFITIKNHFNLDWNQIVQEEPLLFTDCVPVSIQTKSNQKKLVNNVYIEIKDKQQMLKTFNQFLFDYNETKSDKLNLVLFIEALEHIVKIIRVITTRNSHCLLVGLGGLGRKSLTALAAYIVGFQLKTIETTNNYGTKEWIGDLQEILKYAGVENMPTVFLFNHTQIFSEDILEELSSLLSQGEVPGLFPNDEKLKIIDELSYQYEKELDKMSNNERFEFFIKKCKENLHLCLCFSPVGEEFRRRMRSFPSFINNTTIDWFLEWPDVALKAVANSFLNEESIAINKLNSLISLTVNMQTSIKELSERFLNELGRHYYVTPTSYLELLKIFKRNFKQRTIQIENDKKNYEKGVKILEESKEKVKEMKKEIIDLEPKLEIATIETEKLIETVKTEQIEADKKKQSVQKEELICNKNREEAEALQKQCQGELDKVEPLLLKAAKNLKSIQRNHIDFLKQIKNPLPPIKKLFKGLCILYNIKNIPMVKDPKDPYKKIADYQTPTRNVIMAKPDQMLNYLKSYNAESINKMPGEIIKGIKNLQKDEDYDIEAITKVSQAAGKIAGFLNTVIEIYDKLQIINPKRKNLKLAKENLKSAQEELNQKQLELQDVMRKIEDLQKKLKEAKEKSDFLDLEIKRCKRQSIAAEKLVNGLESERLSWNRNIQQLSLQEETIMGDVLLSSGIIAYHGIFPIDYREEILTSWKNILKENKINFSKQFELKGILSNEIVIGSWTNKYNLPNDSYSIDNAIIMENSNRYCLMIDPQNQSNYWIKQKEKENKLIVLKMTQRSNEIQNYIQNAIEIGFPVLFENVDEKLDYNIISVLQNQRKRKGNKIKFKLGNKWYDLSPNFKFYLTTKLSKPHYSPEICVMTTMLNFKVTPLGLEDQMLNILVSKEDPNSEKTRQNNIKEFYELKKKQKVTEENILNLLTNKKEGNLLDDVELIETLQKSKQDAKNAALRIKDIEMMKKKLQNTRHFYSKAANRASNLFFCVTDLGNVEPMYQFSLDWFIDLYKNALNVEPKVKETRVADIIRIFTKMLLIGICPSLFEKDKLLFSFLIYLKTLQCQNMTNLVQLRALFVGTTRIIPKSKNLLIGILSDKQWAELEELQETQEELKDLIDQIASNLEGWTKFIQSKTIYNQEVPQGLENLNDIPLLMLIRCLRPNQLIPFIQNKIEKLLGREFVDFPSFNIEDLYPQTKNSNPIIFVLSSGSEPLADIERLSDILGKGRNTDVLSLGQGQEQIAKKAIEYAKKKGKWIVLQNCHLAPSFLSEIEKVLEDVEHSEFRLWLTSMPTKHFPVTLLQKGIKITNEPPRGIKANILKNYNTFNNKFLENHPKSKEWKKLLFGLSFFHSIVQERRKFSSLGWNIPYEFSQMDLTISLTQTNSMLKDFEDIPWEALIYSIAEANYGGRVTDPMDRRLIKVILSNFIGEKCLSDNYKFSSSGIYFCPEEKDLQGYKLFIKEQFPLNDEPEIFGLHQNAEITSGIKETNQLMVTLLNLLPRSLSSGGQSLDSLITDKANKILEELPDLFEIDLTMQKFPIKYENSMNTVLVQELIRYNKLTKKIKQSLMKLTKAIEGFVIMTDELEEIYQKMLDNQVPECWRKFAYPSVKPLTSWFINFLKRIEFMNDWVQNGQPNKFWISGFFFTQSFLTGILQNYSRLHKIPIDTLVFDFEVISQDQVITNNGSYNIYGLFIEGAKWNPVKGVVVDSEPKVLFTSMPNILITPVKICDQIQKRTYSCPVYKTSVRAGVLSTTGHSTNYVISIDLNIGEKESSEYWIKRGVAMLCELDNQSL